MLAELIPRPWRFSSKSTNYFRPLAVMPRIVWIAAGVRLLDIEGFCRFSATGRTLAGQRSLRAKLWRMSMDRFDDGAPRMPCRFALACLTVVVHFSHI